MIVRDDILLEPRHYEILTSASIAEVRTHVLRHGDSFAVLDLHGDVTRVGNGEQGFYHEGTRFLSRMEFWLQDRRPVLLSSAVRRDNSLLTAHFTNPDFTDQQGRTIVHGALQITRSKLIWRGACYERLRIRNFDSEAVSLLFSLVFEADFVDIFEVRGMKRSHRGEYFAAETAAGRIVYPYRGLDDVDRRTAVTFSPEATEVDASEARYQVEIPPQEHRDFYVTVSCTNRAPLVFEAALNNRRGLAMKTKEQDCQISTSNAQFNSWIDRSLEDVNLLLQEVPEGSYPYAGIPWYNTYFGRDGIITAMMMLWINPSIARGVLGHLAQTQADWVDAERVAEPGKILHESRGGEMAALREIPFDAYYGTVDAVPLFVLLAGAYYRYTGDIAFIQKIWPNIERALTWIERYGDADGDGFVEYYPDPGGLTVQGWKDSEDSVFHADGRLAEGAIALCEVQGYVFAAKRHAARLADLLGHSEMATTLRKEAIRLKARFNESFWDDELGTYALALDGEKRRCLVRTSNAGHTLFSEIAEPSRARRLVESLFERDMYCGWGIRTISSKERRYNPMSYHNGSVWPHDNAMIAWGLARYGYRKHARRLLKIFFDASLFDAKQRLPELYCGFARRPDEGPTPYPVACSPQAWAAASVFFLLQACFGLRVQAHRRRVVLENPTLPSFLREVRLTGLRVGEAVVDLTLQRYTRTVGVDVISREGAVEVITVK